MGVSVTGFEFPAITGTASVYAADLFGGNCTLLATLDKGSASFGTITLSAGSYWPLAGYYSRPNGTVPYQDDFVDLTGACGGGPQFNRGFRTSTLNTLTNTVSLGAKKATSTLFTSGGQLSNEEISELNNQANALGLFLQSRTRNTYSMDWGVNFSSYYVYVPAGESPVNLGSPPSWPTGSTPPDPPALPLPPVPVEYDALTSAAPGVIFVLIKYKQAAGGDWEEVEYLMLERDTVTDLGLSPAVEDWRGEAVSLIPTQDITASLSCVDDYLPDDSAFLRSSTLRRIDLDQDISGDTLRTLLQTSTGTIAATLTTRTATDTGATCTLGTPSTTTVKVPSPGRGRIEGITYLP